jgi:hypothetical protein
MSTAGSIKPAEIYCSSGHEFAWKWRSIDGRSESKQTFTYFYDCYEDAQRRGYTAKFVNEPTRLATPASGGRRAGGGRSHG